MEKKEIHDIAERISAILATHPSINVELAEYNSCEVQELYEKQFSLKDTQELSNDLGVQIIELMEELADIPGMFIKFYKIIHKTRVIEALLFGIAAGLIEKGKAIEAKKMLLELMSTNFNIVDEEK